VDSQNRVWVADGYLNLYNIAQDGTVSQVIKTPVEGGTGRIAIDSKGRVGVIGFDSLYRVLPDFTYQALVPPPSNGGTGRYNFTGIGTDPSGTVYVAADTDAGPGIYSINDDGSLSLAYADEGAGATSLAIGPDHRIWLDSYGPFSVVTPTGGTLVVGDARAVAPGDGGSVNSAGIRQQNLDQTASIVFSPSGDLYFLDGNRIRRLSGLGNATPVPSINPGGVVNAVSYLGGAITPGEIVSIFGSNFGAAAVTSASPENSFYPMGVGRTQVLFNGYPVPITAVAPDQINAIVPDVLTSSATTQSVQVEVDAVLSLAVSVPVATAVPGLSTLDMSGSGETAVINQDGSINSPSNPAARGSIVSFYGTGMGTLYLPPIGLGARALPSQYIPYYLDGAITISTPYPMPLAPVGVTIGGEQAQILYAGAAPFLANGVFQVNVQIPADVAPGNVAVMLTVGGITSIQNVTLAVH
jgi:uncharacterized protein (TIGR03437 family)